MTGSVAALVLIVDPAARPALPEVERALAGRSLEYRIAQADEPSDAQRLAGEALGAGERFLVAVGGDRVVHEVVNGALAAERPEPPILGLLAAGIENHFLQTFGLPLDAQQASLHLTGENAYAIDVGRATFTGSGGAEYTRYFANVIEAGLGAEMAGRAGRLPDRLGRGRLFLGFWGAVLRAGRSTVHVEAARQVYDGPGWSVVVGNGRFGAGGFRVSPRSFPGDGVFEVLIHHGPKSYAFTSLPKAIRGEQVPSPHVAELRGNRGRIDADPSLLLALDGEVVGRTPATFEVVHRAILLKV